MKRLTLQRKQARAQHDDGICLPICPQPQERHVVYLMQCQQNQNVYLLMH